MKNKSTELEEMKRGFKGVWIPKEIWLDDSLSWIEKILYIEIDSLIKQKGCFASNEYFSTFIGVSKSSICNAIHKLKKKKMIELVNFDGRKRFLKIKKTNNHRTLSPEIRLLKIKRQTLRNHEALSTNNRVSKERNRDTPISSFTNKKESPSTTEDRFGKNDLSLSLLEFWNTLGKPLTKHRIDPTLKTYNKIIKTLSLQLKRHKSDIIKKSMLNYHQLLNTENTKLSKRIPGHIVGLSEFFGFSEITKERMKKNKVTLNIKSWFIECKREKGFLELSYGDYIIDVYPEITKQFIEEWKKWKNIKDISIKDENYFRMASIKFCKYWEINYKKIGFDYLRQEDTSPLLCIHYVFDCLEKEVKGKKWLVYPSWFASRRTYKERLDTYFVDKGMMNRKYDEELI